jgi:phage baseplate assembly protein gpV
MAKAKASYSSLKTVGLAEFSFDPVPDWDSVYQSVQPDATAKDTLLPILKKVRFHVLVGPDGASTISHENNQAPPSEEVAERMRSSIDGTEKVVTGFLQTWSGFAINSIIPEADTDYEVTEFPDGYRLFAKDGAVELTINFDKTLLITNFHVVSSEFQGEVSPKFVASKAGLQLAAYDADYKAPGGGEQHLSVTIKNEDADGVSVPASINATVEVGPGKTVAFPFVFENRHVKLTPKS